MLRREKEEHIRTYGLYTNSDKNKKSRPAESYTKYVPKTHKKKNRWDWNSSTKTVHSNDDDDLTSTKSLAYFENVNSGQRLREAGEAETFTNRHQEAMILEKSNRPAQAEHRPSQDRNCQAHKWELQRHKAGHWEVRRIHRQNKRAPFVWKTIYHLYFPFKKKKLA